MKTFYCLGTVAVLAATAGVVYTGLPAIATPPAVPPVPVPPSKTAAWTHGTPPELPPVVVDPDVSWPVRLPEKAISEARAEGAKPAIPAPLPVAPPPQPVVGPVKPVAMPKPMPALPSVALPPVPMPVVVQPSPEEKPAPLPVVPPPVIAPPMPTAPVVAPVATAQPKPIPKPSPLPAVPPPPPLVKQPQPVPPPVAAQPKPASPAPLPAVPPPVATQPKPATPAPLPPVPPPAATATTKKPDPQPSLPPPTPIAQPSLPPPTPIAQPARPPVGQAVLLQDGKIVEGKVAKEGDKIIVRRGVIDQPFEKEKVRYIGDSKDDVYRFLLGKLKPDDADGRFKLARWCVFNGMREQALDEVSEVVKLQPQHTLAREMMRTLEESIRLFNADGTPVSAPAPAAPPSAPATAPGLPAVPPPTTQATPPAPNAVVEQQQLDINPEAVLVFGPRVQPILVNGCAECHAKADYSGAFKLACGSGHGADASTTRQNLLAAAGQIDRKNPAASPLLVKSLSLHGGMTRPAIIGPQAPAYRVLEAWVHLAAGSKETSPSPPSPSATPAPAAVPPTPPMPTTPVLPPPPIPPAADPKPLPPAIPPASTAPDFGADAEPKPPATAPDPTSTDKPVDDFDPSIFNRAVHPSAR